MCCNEDVIRFMSHCVSFVNTGIRSNDCRQFYFLKLGTYFRDNGVVVHDSSNYIVFSEAPLCQLCIIKLIKTRITTSR